MFLKPTETELLNVSLARLVRDTDISVTSPGSVARTIFELISGKLGYSFTVLDHNISQLFLSSAGGEALDLWGKIFGLTRKTVSGTVLANQSNVLFYLSDQPDPKQGRGIATAPAPVRVTIPAGTTIATAPISGNTLPTVWKTASPTVLEAGQYIAYADVTPVSGLGDTTPKGTLLYHDFPAAGIEALDGLYLQVYNRDDLQVQTSYESDTNFRYRIHYAIRTLATGNAMALRLAALAVPGVRDCKVVPLAAGVGTAKVVIVLEEPGSPAGDAAFSSAAAKVLEAKAAGDLVFVRRPAELAVETTVAVYFKATAGAATREAIRTNVAAAIARSINQLSAGEPLALNKVIHDAMSVSPDILDVVFVPGVGLIINSTPQAIMNYTVTDEEQLFAPDGSVTILEQ